MNMIFDPIYLTKAFTDPVKWLAGAQLINVIDPSKFWHKQDIYSEPTNSNGARGIF